MFRLLIIYLISLKFEQCLTQEIRCSIATNVMLIDVTDEDILKAFNSCDVNKEDISELTESPEFHTDDPDSIELVVFRNTAKEFIPTTMYKYFPNMVSLDVVNDEGEKLTSLKSSYFKNAQQLKYMSFRHNDLQTIEANTFGDAVNLVFLYLTNNRIKTIHELAFTGLTKMKCILISFNYIYTFKGNPFAPLTAVQHVGLNKNICIDSNFRSANINESSLIDIERELRDQCEFFGTDSLKEEFERVKKENEQLRKGTYVSNESCFKPIIWTV